MIPAFPAHTPSSRAPRWVRGQSRPGFPVSPGTRTLRPGRGTTPSVLTTRLCPQGAYNPMMDGGTAVCWRTERVEPALAALLGTEECVHKVFLKCPLPSQLRCYSVNPVLAILSLMPQG